MNEFKIPEEVFDYLKFLTDYADTLTGARPIVDDEGD